MTEPTRDELVETALSVAVPDMNDFPIDRKRIKAIRALVARLQAAEKVITMGLEFDSDEQVVAYMVWCALAKGRE